MANRTNYSNVDDSVSAISGGNLEGNGTRGSTEQVTCDYLRCLGDYIFTVSNPIITVVSVLGNILTLIVMSRRSLRYSTVAVHLSALATSDSLVLIMDTLYNWFKTVIKINLIGLSDGFCKFHRFFFHVVYTYSAWIVTSLAVERFIVVWFPLRAKHICSYRNSVINVVLLPVPIVALYLYHLWTWSADEEQQCSIESQWYEFQSNVGPLLSYSAYCYIPVIALVSLNAAIIGKLSLARNLRRQMSIDASASEKKETRITMTIVVICIFYVIMTVPLSIYYTLVYRMGEYIRTTPQLYLVRVIINMVSSCSYGMTFFLYVLTSGGFRKHLRDLFCCGRGCCTSRSTEFDGAASVDPAAGGFRSQVPAEEEFGVSVISSGNSSSTTIPSSDQAPSRMPSRSRECTAL